MLRSALPTPFVVDDDDDQTYASNRHSRYGAYLAHNADMFISALDDRVGFALAAWAIANSPIMTPGYVRAHPRVLDTLTGWDSDYRPAITVALAAPMPATLATTAVGSWLSWQHTGHGDREYWYEPEHFDRPVVLATVAMRVPIPVGRLPEPRYHGTRRPVPDTATAQHAVRELCRVLNVDLAAVVAALTTPAT